GERSGPPNALKNPTATIARLVSVNQRHLRWPTDEMGNLYKVGTGHHTAEETVSLYRRDLIAGSLPFTIDDVRRELKGRDLLCWCKLVAPCHDDVLLALASGGGLNVKAPPEFQDRSDRRMVCRTYRKETSATNLMPE